MLTVSQLHLDVGRSRCSQPVDVRLVALDSDHFAHARCKGEGERPQPRPHVECTLVASKRREQVLEPRREGGCALRLERRTTIDAAHDLTTVRVVRAEETPIPHASS